MRFSKQTGMLSESMEDGAYRPCAACARPRSFAKLETRDSKFDVQRRGVPRRQRCSQDQRLNGFLLGIISPTTSNTTLNRAFKRKQRNAALC